MFQNREEAGKLLAEKLKKFKRKATVVVLSIPRGGVVIGKEVAHSLQLSHDIIVIKKIGAPQNPELAIGAVGPNKTVYWDKALIKKLEIGNQEQLVLKTAKEVEQRVREEELRKGKGQVSIKNKTVILVDDGVATGSTILCARLYAQTVQAKRIILATPVISEDTFRSIKKYFDIVIALQIEKKFYAVGQFYQEFPQVSDDEVITILRD